MERALIYGLIFKVQNQLNLLEEKEVSPIKMTKSEFLDATHISDYALNVYEASDADYGNTDCEEFRRGVQNYLDFI